MNRIIILLSCSLFFMACGTKTPDKHMVINSEDTTAFFPAEDFILGQIAEIESKPINPLLVRKDAKNNQDSVWLKQEDVRDSLQLFIFPHIAESALKENYDQSRFYDQSLPAITFTYSPKPGKTSLEGLENWNIYIDPKSEKVLRIFFRRSLGDTLLLINWEANKFASLKKAIKIGDSTILTEKTIQWDLTETL